MDTERLRAQVVDAYEHGADAVVAFVVILIHDGHIPGSDKCDALWEPR